MFNVLLVSLEVRCPRWSALMPVFHRVTSQVFFSGFFPWACAGIKKHALNKMRTQSEGFQNSSLYLLNVVELFEFGYIFICVF